MPENQVHFFSTSSSSFSCEKVTPPHARKVACVENLTPIVGFYVIQKSTKSREKEEK